MSDSVSYVPGQRIVYRTCIGRSLYEPVVVELSPSRRLLKLDPGGWLEESDIHVVEVLNPEIAS